MPKQVGQVQPSGDDDAEHGAEGAGETGPAAGAAATPAAGRGKGRQQAVDVESAMAKRLAELEAENAALRQTKATPAAVIELNTPHNARKWADSEFKQFTTLELIEKIDAGEIAEPRTAVLCGDGWYAPRR